MSNARLSETVSPEWAVLRVWAAEIRDAATSLVAILDEQHRHHKTPSLASQLWQTALLMRDDLRLRQQQTLPTTVNTKTTVAR